MKLSTPFMALLAAGLFLSGADAGTVLLPALSTDSGPLNPVEGFTSSRDFPVSLESGRGGLIPGDPILITVRGSDPIVWAGAITYGAGDLTFQLKATLSLTIGEETGSTDVRFGGSYPGITEQSGPGGVLGYQISDAAPAFSFTVPWDTDLSRAVFTLSQDSLLTGTAQGRFTRSSMIAAGSPGSFSGPVGPLIIDLQSIPEPGSAGLALLAAGFCLVRRRAVRPLAAPL